MKPSLIFRNDWKWLSREMQDITLIHLSFERFAGHYWYFNILVMGLGFTIGAFNQQAADALADEIMSGQLHDDPEAHLGWTWTRDGYVAHVGAQTATVTREPLNLPSNEDGS